MLCFLPFILLPFQQHISHTVVLGSILTETSLAAIRSNLFSLNSWIDSEFSEYLSLALVGSGGVGSFLKGDSTQDLPSSSPCRYHLLFRRRLLRDSTNFYTADRSHNIDKTVINGLASAGSPDSGNRRFPRKGGSSGSSFHGTGKVGHSGFSRDSLSLTLTTKTWTPLDGHGWFFPSGSLAGPIPDHAEVSPL